MFTLAIEDECRLSNHEGNLIKRKHPLVLHLANCNIETGSDSFTPMTSRFGRSLIMMMISSIYRGP